MAGALKPFCESRTHVPGRKAHRRPLLALYDQGGVDPNVSRVMSRNRGKDTGPELRLRKALWASGVRYRCHPEDIPGRPDIVHRGARVAVFVDGCFWHGCPRHFRTPHTRSAFWREKIRRNKATRRRVLGQLRPAWEVLEFYECELQEDLEGCARKVAVAIRHHAPSRTTL